MYWSLWLVLSRALARALSSAEDPTWRTGLLYPCGIIRGLVRFKLESLRLGGATPLFMSICCRVDNCLTGEDLREEVEEGPVIG